MEDRSDLSFEVKDFSPSQRIIEGYASTSDLDHGDDIVEPGACKFLDPSDVGVFVGHDWRNGALPVGIPLEIRQDGARLYTKTRIHATQRGDELLAVTRERLAAGKPLGMSIGYPTDRSLVVRWDRKDGRPVRRIQQLQLREYSFTAMPMNEHAIVTAVKQRGQDLPAHVQRALRDFDLWEIEAMAATYGRG